MHGEPPDGDHWEPTLKGLLASKSAAFAEYWIERALELCRGKARSEGAFVRFTWLELKAIADNADNREDSIAASVHLVIRVAGLENGHGSLPPPDLWYCGRPLQFEELIQVRTATELLEYRERSAQTIGAQGAQARIDRGPASPSQPNQDARALLAYFYAGYQKVGSRNFSIRPSSEVFAQLDMNNDRYRRAMHRLIDKGLLKPFALGGACRMTESAVEVSEDSDVLNELLPVNDTTEHHPTRGRRRLDERRSLLPPRRRHLPSHRRRRRDAPRERAPGDSVGGDDLTGRPDCER
jgi:hypothetical protein